MDLHRLPSTPSLVRTRSKRKFVPEEEKTNEYWIKRQKNNKSAQKSRNRKKCFGEAMKTYLEKLQVQNKKLKYELGFLTEEYVNIATKLNLTSSLDKARFYQAWDTKMSSELLKTQESCQNLQKQYCNRTQPAPMEPCWLSFHTARVCPFPESFGIPEREYLKDIIRFRGLANSMTSSNVSISQPDQIMKQSNPLTGNFKFNIQTGIGMESIPDTIYQAKNSYFNTTTKERDNDGFNTIHRVGSNGTKATHFKECYSGLSEDGFWDGSAGVKYCGIVPYGNDIFRTSPSLHHFNGMTLDSATDGYKKTKDVQTAMRDYYYQCQDGINSSRIFMTEPNSIPTGTSRRRSMETGILNLHSNQNFAQLHWKAILKNKSTNQL